MTAPESPKITTAGCAQDIAMENGNGMQVYVDCILDEGQQLICYQCPLEVVGGQTSAEDAAIQVAEHCLFYGPNKRFSISKE